MPSTEQVFVSKDNLKKMLHIAKHNFFDYLYDHTKYFFYKQTYTKFFIFKFKREIKLSKKEARIEYDKRGLEETLTKMDCKYRFLFQNLQLLLEYDERVLVAISMPNFQLLVNIINSSPFSTSSNANNK